MSDKPLIAHVLYRLDTGGMERVLVSLINATQDRFRHAVITLAGFGAMRAEIETSATVCLSLDKRPGKDWACYLRFWRALRKLKPDLVQTYNIGTLDLAPVVKLAGVGRLVHAEHGRDVSDPNGDKVKYQRLRRWMAPCINRFVAVSADLERWLIDRVGIPAAKVEFIPNAIDTAAFHVQRDSSMLRQTLGDLAPPGTILVGNIARLDKVKDQAGLLTAFKHVRERCLQEALDCRLVIAGEGPQQDELKQLIDRLGLADSATLLGNRSDVAAVLADCDVFVLSSVAEGIPLTVLEAMASGLPVVATRVGDVGEVVVDGESGTLVAPSDPQALAAALGKYARDPELRRRHGLTGQVRASEKFSLPVMVLAYAALYDDLLQGHRDAAASHRTDVLARRGEP